MLRRVKDYIRAHSLLLPGERIGVAVSGGADSVALLRTLLDLRTELGIVLSVVHFNHKIRGAESDADEQFVRALAEQSGLQLHHGEGNAPAFARSENLSLETAARRLRYEFFWKLLAASAIDKISTAHTLDDQAETVLMRLLRGTGTTGLAGIYPELREEGPRGGFSRSIVRPMLEVRRKQVEEYLRSIQQAWREDSSNRDLHPTRNRVRHELLPMLEHFNPAVTKILAETAEIARAEEEYWQAEVERLLPNIFCREGESATGCVSIEIEGLLNFPVAVQRRVLRAAADQAGLSLDFEQTEVLRRLAGTKATLHPKQQALSGGFAELVKTSSGRELRFRFGSPNKSEISGDYEYLLRVPGEIAIGETGTVIRARFVEGNHGENGNNGGSGSQHRQHGLINSQMVGRELTVRNWRAGDRYWPARSKAPKKIKELLQAIPQDERRFWPVIASGDEIIWMRGFAPSERFAANQAASSQNPGAPKLLIEEVPQIRHAEAVGGGNMRSKSVRGKVKSKAEACQ